MHLITNYCSGHTNRVEDEERAWPMKARQESNGRWIKKDFPGQYAIGSTHGGRAGEVVTSFKAFACSKEIADLADSDGGMTEFGEYYIASWASDDLILAAKKWQRNCRKEAKREKLAKLAEAATAAIEKQQRHEAAQGRAKEFLGDIEAWLAAPFHPAPPAVAAAKQASGLSWGKFTKIGARK